MRKLVLVGFFKEDLENVIKILEAVEGFDQEELKRLKSILLKLEN